VEFDFAAVPEKKSGSFAFMPFAKCGRIFLDPVHKLGTAHKNKKYGAFQAETSEISGVCPSPPVHPHESAGASFDE
jgi:hypothetical protein